MSDIKLSDIRTDGLFLNADAGFDTTGFREYCYRNEIIDNIDQNKRNVAKMEQFFDDLLTNTGLWLKGPMPGSMLLKQFWYVLKQIKYIRKH